MAEMVESIKKYGVLVPALVRPKEDGGYEMVAGHRRKFAASLAGVSEIPCIVRSLTDDEATIVMVDSNLQREKILPSEKAFAYKMKLEAMKRQAGRPSKENSVPVGQNFEGKTSRELLAAKSPDSNTQIQRYIRLTELIPPVLQMVDDGKIAFRPAVELSYLSKEQQESLYSTMECEDCTPSLAQAIKMKEFSKDGKLTDNEELSGAMESREPEENQTVSYSDSKESSEESTAAAGTESPAVETESAAAESKTTESQSPPAEESSSPQTEPAKSVETQTTPPPQAEQTEEMHPEEESTPQPAEEPAVPEFDIQMWVDYAMGYAESVGLNLSPDATACWDNPITAGSHSLYLERDKQKAVNQNAALRGIAILTLCYACNISFRYRAWLYMCAGGQISKSVLLLFVPVAGNIAIFGDSSDRSDDIDFLYHRQPEKAFSCRTNQSDRITFD